MEELSRQAKGGLAAAAKMTPEERKERSRKANEARRREFPPSTPKAKCSGILKIGNIQIPCAVLSDGTRILTETGISNALGGRSATSINLKQKMGGQISNFPVFLAVENLIPYFQDCLGSAPFLPISYSEGRKLQVGYDAKILPEICSIWLQGRRHGVLHHSQLERAAQAEILQDALAKIGIVALIDEATGYQVDREKEELQTLLGKYLSAERLKWVSTFPAEFFKQIYRLHHWIMPDSSARTPEVGRIINKIVYEQLPEGVLGELRIRNPIDIETGRRRSKHFQFLSNDIGLPDLQTHLVQLITFMRASTDWRHFQELFQAVFYPQVASKQKYLEFWENS